MSTELPDTSSGVRRAFGLGEPTALAYTPDNYPGVVSYLAHGLNEPNALLEAALDAPDPVETVALAVESARRWARRTDLSPELRLRRIWTVLEAALR